MNRELFRFVAGNSATMPHPEADGNWRFHNPSQGLQWLALKSHLIENKYAGNASAREIVKSLDLSTNRILFKMGYPNSESTAFRIQGLVLGRVQSGKTANYTALIAKAADAGYKLFIVLSGIHNSLRQQTQIRLQNELGLLGSRRDCDSRQESKWLCGTTDNNDGDFDASRVPIGELCVRTKVIVISKKNATVLGSILKWLKANPPASQLPTLIIDDEADQASINTRNSGIGVESHVPGLEYVSAGPDGIERDQSSNGTGPSAINCLIRTIIAKFDKVSYVAYTATPFANVLINPRSSDPDSGEDLYPRDFIVSLPTPDGYFGALQLFGSSLIEQQDAPNFLNFIPETETDYLGSEIAFAAVTKATDSLRYALLDFLIAAAAKDHRLGIGRATMLVHTSHRVELQNRLAQAIRTELDYLRNQWRYNTAGRDLFLNHWLSRFGEASRSTEEQGTSRFNLLAEYLSRIFERPVALAVFHSEGDEDWKRDDPHEKVVVVGGNRLSRGLTLDGLITSLFIRRSGNYDTMLQMGRWFGFRQAYVDLMRLWTTDSLSRGFRHLADVEEDIRDQIRVYENRNISPLDIAPAILSHPELQITAREKMQDAQEHEFNYSERLLQSIRVPLHDVSALESNLTETKRFLRALGAKSSADPERMDAHPHWQNATAGQVIEYLRRFLVLEESSSFDPIAIAEYIKHSMEIGELTSWWVSIKARMQFDAVLGAIDFGSKVGYVNSISRTQRSDDLGNLGVLVNPALPSAKWRSGDEETGLTDEQINSARIRADQHGRTYPIELRHERLPRQGLLCIYPVSQFSRTTSPDRRPLFEATGTGCPVIALALSFPRSLAVRPSRFSIGHQL